MSPPSPDNPLLLRGGRVIDPAGGLDSRRDVLIEDGRISAIGERVDAPKGTDVIDLPEHYWVTPGLVDIHVHFRDPGQSAKETTMTGAAAAIAGGFTTVCIMPNTSPAIDNVQTLQYVNRIGAETGIRIIPVPGVTKDLDGKELTAMGTMVDYGAVAFTDDGMPIVSAQMMRKALQYAAMFDVPIVCHAEDPTLCGCGVMNEGLVSTRLGLPGIPGVAESTMVARDIILARDTGGHVHFAHLSTAESVRLVREAKAEGLKITAESTPHNLTLTDDTLSDYNPDYKMYGPIRTEADRQALVEGLLDGTIDAIATDHAPHTPEEKARTVDEAPRGVIGLETSLGAILTFLYHQPQGHRALTPVEVIRLMGWGGVQAYGIDRKIPDCGRLQVGGRADITVIDPDRTWRVNPDEFRSKSRNCPFNGMVLTGRAVMTIAAGACMMDRREEAMCVGAT
ncbi:MAG: dihydroorotase [Candidatus Melainabacteria bacterium]